MDIEQAFLSVFNGKSVLFLGAGFSVGATNVAGNSMKDSRALNKHFQTLLHEDESLPLEELADMYIDEFGVENFVKELNNLFVCSSPTAVQEVIAALPWKRIYTTNYDDVFERAAKNQGKNIESYTLSDSVKHSDLSLPAIVHLNGSIRSLTTTNARTELKLSESSYISESVTDSPWCGLFREDVSYSASVFYIGYTAYDIDIRRVLTQTGNTREKSFFFCGEPDRATARRIERYGFDTKQYSDDFANRIEDAKTNWKPDAAPKIDYLSFQEFSVPALTSGVSASIDDVFDFFLLGVTDNVPMAGEQSIAVKRSAESLALEALEREDSVVILHSAFGNGKSVLVEQISARAIEKGFNIFNLVKSTESVFEEIDSLINTKDLTLLCIEDYVSYLDEIEYLASRKTPNIRLMLTSRTVVHEFNAELIVDLFGEDDIRLVVCDRLNDHDIELLSSIFDQYGLWGSDAGLDSDEKKNILAKDCKRELQAILLRLLRSPQIHNRLSDILSTVRSQNEFYDALLILCILVHAQVEPNLDLLVDSCGTSLLAAEFHNHKGLRQLINFESGEFRLRSSILARFLLSELSSSVSVIDALISAYLALDRHYSHHGNYEDQLMRLNRFSVIEPIVPAKEKVPNMVRFYEEIGKANYSQENPDYWLQYGIACTTFGRFERAEQYLDSAESYARNKRRWGKLIQIQNHRSRFLLELASKESDLDDAWRRFVEARKIIEEQLKIRPRQFTVMTYPFKRASLYEGFVEKFKKDFTSQQRKEIRDSVEFVERKIGILEGHWRRRKDVRSAVRAMDNIKKLLA